MIQLRFYNFLKLQSYYLLSDQDELVLPVFFFLFMLFWDLIVFVFFPVIFNSLLPFILTVRLGVIYHPRYFPFLSIAFCIISSFSSWVILILKLFLFLNFVYSLIFVISFILWLQADLVRLLCRLISIADFIHSFDFLINSVWKGHFLFCLEVSSCQTYLVS